MGGAFGRRTSADQRDGQLTYRELDAHANAYARWALAQGLAKGDAVALMMPNRPEYVAIWFGLARVGVGDRAGQHQPHRRLARPLAERRSARKRRDRRLCALRRLSPRARDEIGEETAVWCYGEAAAATRGSISSVAKLSRAPLAAAERPRRQDQRRRALHLHVGHDGSAEGGAHHPFARAARHVRLRRRARRRPSDRFYMCLPMYHTNGGMIAPGLALPFGGSAFIRERFSARAFWSDVVRAEVHDVRLYRRALPLSAQRARRPGRSRAQDPRLHRQRLAARHFRRSRRASASPAVLEFYAATEGNAVMINFEFAPRRDRPHPEMGAQPVSDEAWSPTITTPTRQRATPTGRCRACAARRGRRTARRNPRRSQNARRALRRLRRRRRRRGRRCCATCSSRATPGSAPATWCGGTPRAISISSTASATRSAGRARTSRRPKSPRRSRSSGRAGGGRLRRRRARPRRPRRHGGAGRRYRPRHSISTACAPSRRAPAGLCAAAVPALPHRKSK